MRSFEDALNLLAVIAKDVVRLEKAHKDILNSPLQAADKAERADRVGGRYCQAKAGADRGVGDLVFPSAMVARRWSTSLETAPNGKSVFVMTKHLTVRMRRGTPSCSA
jgi:hypothetical protein